MPLKRAGVSLYSAVKQRLKCITGRVCNCLIQFFLTMEHCATNRKVAGSIPDGVTGFFYLHNPSGRTMVLGSTRPLT
jgi:hypothetical protein